MLELTAPGIPEQRGAYQGGAGFEGETESGGGAEIEGGTETEGGTEIANTRRLKRTIMAR